MAGRLSDTDLALLVQVLEEAQRRGFLGPGDVDKHVPRALDFAAAVDLAAPVDPAAAVDLAAAVDPAAAVDLAAPVDPAAAVDPAAPVDPPAPVAEPPGQALDLGSGGGLPGLPLALLWRNTRFVLLDGSVTRTRFLSEAVRTLDLEDRVSVVAERAEVAGRGPLRGSFDLVLARSFGSPAVTAECGSPFLKVGGRLVVAEPPGGAPDRWPPSGLALLGLRPGGALTSPSALQVLEQVEPCPDGFPRRTGIPAKRPLF